MNRTSTRLLLALVTGLVTIALPASAAPSPPTSVVRATALFELHSDFETNLNDALVAAGLARHEGQPELFRRGEEKSCFDEQTAGVRAGWNEAVDYYGEIVSPGGWNGREQFLIRLQLAGIDDGASEPAARRVVEIARAFRTAAAPAYEACRWQKQDARNRRWIDELVPRLVEAEPKLRPRLEQLYRKPWDGLPIRVDVVETVNWAGANSIYRDPAGGHLLVSPSFEGPAALEVVFHEASHLLMRRDDPVQRALARAAEAAGRELPRDLWHVVLFHTTGEAVRRYLEERGARGYEPMLHGIFRRGDWVELRRPVETAWSGYLAGERSLEEAASNLVELLEGR